MNAGKDVTVTKSNINFEGWMGCGYIITDPTTGAGSYMISGGLNGMEMEFAGTAVMLVGALVMLAFMFLFAPIIAPIIAMLGFLIFAVGFAMATENYTTEDWRRFGCLFAGIFFNLVAFGSIPRLASTLLTAESLAILLDNNLGIHALPCQGIL